jgi:hypothetical protein
MLPSLSAGSVGFSHGLGGSGCLGSAGGLAWARAKVSFPPRGGPPGLARVVPIPCNPARLQTRCIACGGRMEKNRAPPHPSTGADLRTGQRAAKAARAGSRDDPSARPLYRSTIRALAAKESSSGVAPEWANAGCPNWASSSRSAWRALRTGRLRAAGQRRRSPADGSGRPVTILISDIL